MIKFDTHAYIRNHPDKNSKVIHRVNKWISALTRDERDKIGQKALQHGKSMFDYVYDLEKSKTI